MLLVMAMRKQEGQVEPHLLEIHYAWLMAEQGVEVDLIIHKVPEPEDQDSLEEAAAAEDITLATCKHTQGVQEETERAAEAVEALAEKEIKTPLLAKGETAETEPSAEEEAAVVGLLEELGGLAEQETAGLVVVIMHCPLLESMVYL